MSTGRALRPLWLAALVILVSVLGSQGNPHAGTAPTCLPIVVGNDTSSAISIDAPILGQAEGQVFVAEDTLISAITVWLDHYGIIAIGAHLFIVNVDSTGYPLTHEILLNGPTVGRTQGDGVNPVPIRFELDPPFALPAKGRYAFCVQAEGCFTGSPWWVLIASDSYPDGYLFLTNRALTTCHLAYPYKEGPDIDLVFQIEFCRDTVNPVRQKRWGELKILYR